MWPMLNSVVSLNSNVPLPTKLQSLLFSVAYLEFPQLSLLPPFASCRF